MRLVYLDFPGFNVVGWEGPVLMLRLQDDSQVLTLD